MGGRKMAVAYDPTKHYEIKVWDVAYRHDPVRTLLARIYQPQGAGPFPALLDVHGGAWNDQDRTANAPVDERLAASGILVVAIDVRLAKEAPCWNYVPCVHMILVTRCIRCRRSHTSTRPWLTSWPALRSVTPSPATSRRRRCN